MRIEDSARITQRLVELRMEHRDLDAAIERLQRDSNSDQLQLTRMKKRKLQLKDAIARLESRLIPDLDA
ncbi:MAG TPA: YdcH family protein [Rhodanobacteraceae bacterium]|nr:YdcH family protein [Rhodanobacteraceae bacterium]